MSTEQVYPIELAVSEKHLLLLESIARRCRGRVSEIAGEMLEEYVDIMDEIIKDKDGNQ